MSTKLNARTLPDKPGRHSDGNGLYLVVKKSGAASWVLIYQISGKRIERGLGSARTVKLSDARAKAKRAQAELVLGVDPFASPALDQTPFKRVALDYIDGMRPSWRNAKHGDQWVATLKTHAADIWDSPVSGITTAEVLAVLQPVWSRIPETAMRVRGRIERVLDAAKVRGFRDGENPARWRGHLDKLLPKRKKSSVEHHPAMPFQDLPSFVGQLRKRDALSARALEFLILTAARTGEVLGAEWEEFDLAAKVWTVPAGRIKMGVEHRVPLTARMVAILEHVKFLDDPKPFPLSNMSMAMLMRRMEMDAFSVHGFRSAFRDWVGEETDFARELAEAALAHQVGNEVERAYRRGDALNRRRALMEAWEVYLST